MPFMMHRSYDFTVTEDANLGTLLGFPKIIEGDFSLGAPDLTSLKHFPKIIVRDAYIWAENVKEITCKFVIINAHLKGERDLQKQSRINRERL
ncbi:MAG: hypothetical protein QXN55_00435 [Candidatus Nitrosotenuis sp.]